MAKKDWHHLYNTKAWKRLRAEQLRQAPLCAMCSAEGRITPATVADHVKPHKGDRSLFFGGELQSLCKPHHDGEKQRQEARGYSNAVGPDGWPLDPSHPSNRSSPKGAT